MLSKYADALQRGSRGELAELKANIKASLNAGDLDDDAAALWFMGCTVDRRSYHLDALTVTRM